MNYLLTRHDKFCDSAALMAETLGYEVLRGEWGEPFPDDLFGDYLISFLCPWVVPRNTLTRFKLCINFHPGTSFYPGIGCYNFALYNQSRFYGAVAHFMEPDVDTGDIFESRTFEIAARETVETLRNRTLCVMLGMFSDIMERFPYIPPKREQWARVPYTRKDLEELCVLRTSMDGREIKNRMRACEYGKFSARFG